MNYTIGLDIGVKSVGWCVINNDKNRIEDLGVRKFESAEQPKAGSSLAEPRRLSRSVRRRLRRRRIRLKKLRELFIKQGFAKEDELPRIYINSSLKDPWQLRAEALDRKLNNEELIQVLTHLCKRRGYKSMRLKEKADSDEGKVKGSIAKNISLMTEKGYRTAGEMIYKDEEFSQSKRNHGDYNNTVSREMLLDEIRIIFEQQKKLGNNITDDFINEYIEIFSWQKPIDEGEKLIEKVGYCTFCKDEKRAPKRCWTAEKFTLLQKINNINLYKNGEIFPLNDEQRKAIFDKCLTKKDALSYKDIRNLLDLSEDIRFNSVEYKDDLSQESKHKLPDIKGYHEIKTAICKADEHIWEQIVNDEDLLDNIAYVLTWWKNTESIKKQLKLLGLNERIIEALGNIRFDKNMHLSIKAMRKINPYLEQGLIYSKACEAAGFNHYAPESVEKQYKLPIIPTDQINNPVVLRALAQARKVLNSIISKYGSPQMVKIELARDIAKNFEERNKIAKSQRVNQEKNEEARKQIEEVYNIRATGTNIRKYRLWFEQQSRCIYSGQYIDPVRMLSEDGYAEIEHIIPYTRCFDSSYRNLVIALGEENRKKGNRIPYEYFGGDEQRWREFTERVNSLKLSDSKKNNLLRKTFDSRAENEFKNRNLQDTQYAASFFANFVRNNLITTGEGKNNVITVNGQATAYLRARWGITKIREESDKHHALDAAVVAVTSRAMIQKIANFLSWKQFRKAGDMYVDEETGEVFYAKKIPQPWEGFSQELMARLSENPRENIRKLNLPSYSNEDLSFVRPIFVSRMPRRKVTGPAHEETVRRFEGYDEKGMIKTSKKISITELNYDKLEQMVGKESDPAVYNTLKQRLDEFDGNAKKAFASPVYKPKKDGSNGSQIKGIRIWEKPASGGVRINNGIADNGRMIRIDIFEKDKKYYIVPVYTKDVVKDGLPDKAIVPNKPEGLWIQIDDSFSFKFSVYPNELIEITRKKGKEEETLFGYYIGCNRNNGSIEIEEHDSSKSYGSIGVRNLKTFKKYNVDILGNKNPIKGEKRIGFSQRNHNRTCNTEN